MAVEHVIRLRCDLCLETTAEEATDYHPRPGLSLDDEAIVMANRLAEKTDDWPEIPDPKAPPGSGLVLTVCPKCAPLAVALADKIDELRGTAPHPFPHRLVQLDPLPAAATATAQLALPGPA